jgi:hypothetical protein
MVHTSHDVWYGSTTFAYVFPYLFAKTRKSFASLATVWNGGFSKLFLTQDISRVVRAEKTLVLQILTRGLLIQGIVIQQFGIITLLVFIL